MNTRKHSARIAHLPQFTIRIASVISKARLRIIACLMAVMLLTSCATGRAPEANQGQKADQQRTSVITDMQATHTWELINSTPDSTPTAEP